MDDIDKRMEAFLDLLNDAPRCANCGMIMGVEYDYTGEECWYCYHCGHDKIKEGDEQND